MLRHRHLIATLVLLNFSTSSLAEEAPPQEEKSSLVILQKAADIDTSPTGPASHPRPAAVYAGNAGNIYPSASLKAGHEGDVKLKVLVKADGSVGKASIQQSSGYEELDNVALESVKQWRFRPGTDANGNTKETFVTLPFSFRQNGYDFLESSCRDATAEVQEMRSKHPDMPLDAIGPFRKSVYYVGKHQKFKRVPAEEVEQFQREAPALLEAIAADCATHPRWKYQKVLAKHMGKYVPFLLE